MDVNLSRDIVQILGAWGTLLLVLLYLVYQTIKDWLNRKTDKQKDKAIADFQSKVYEQLQDSADVNREMLSFLKINVQQYASEINETQARLIIEYMSDAFLFQMKEYLHNIIVENHLQGNEREITAKVKTFTSNLYQSNSLSMKEFKYKGKSISQYFKEDWKEYIIENSLDIILNEKGDKALDSMINNAFETFKVDLSGKLFQ